MTDSLFDFQVYRIRASRVNTVNSASLSGYLTPRPLARASQQLTSTRPWRTR
jgi:hypothetical protein